MKAILFDLDCTLTDRVQSIENYAIRFHQDFQDRLKSIKPSEIGSMILVADGEGGYRSRYDLFDDLLQMLPWNRPPDVSMVQIHWQTWFPASTIGREGLHETLSALQEQGIRLGIITNGTIQVQKAKIEALHIQPYFSTVIISEAVKVQKPDPRIFAQGLADLDCLPSQAWYVGDHPVNDVLGAAAAGLRPVWFTGILQWPVDHPEPRWKISSMSELMSMARHENDLES